MERHTVAVLLRKPDPTPSHQLIRSAIAVRVHFDTTVPSWIHRRVAARVPSNESAGS